MRQLRRNAFFLIQQCKDVGIHLQILLLLLVFLLALLVLLPWNDLHHPFSYHSRFAKNWMGVSCSSSDMNRYIPYHPDESMPMKQEIIVDDIGYVKNNNIPNMDSIVTMLQNLNPDNDEDSIVINREPVKRIVLLGERNSGSNFAFALLRRAFPDYMLDHNQDVPVLFFKHMFRHQELSQSEIRAIQKLKDVLWVLIIRDACDWVEAMKRKPWHRCPDSTVDACLARNDEVWLQEFVIEAAKRLTLTEFFQKEWIDWAESVDTIYNGQTSSPLNSTYDNIFHLRAHKLKIMKQVVSAVPLRVKIVKFSEAEEEPDALIRSLSSQFNLSLSGDYEMFPTKRTMRHKKICLNFDEWNVANSLIDWDLEYFFGFTQLDCVPCF